MYQNTAEISNLLMGSFLENRAIAPCITILPGVTLRQHAQTLLSLNRWFLHERP
ncbi:hypothetical protein [Gloeocapsa sp. PCC 73106]|uniref:hypothetical protein n=1 Tax=Gloeocapsa sp. PCC 73106 TaxID=102232 RepID=UPI0002AC0BCE|nr:hypothetical protein [Gloeocapsa sp. PCC 73106]ELR99905.1 hypothetical protein GLO73106DRAFT_00037580 [Gloeocapsa sp. PCC 73106]